MSEILAAFTDSILRKGGSNKAANIDLNDKDQVLSKVVQIFMHLVDKDLFIEVFKSYLAKRLLNEKSVSIDAEKSMISHIKMSCGP